jgi:hypothetical protein
MAFREDGVSLLELTIAMALTLAVTASVFVATSAGWSTSAGQPDIADMQQRLRVAAVAITGDLGMAGAGSQLAAPSVPLVYAFPPVLPFRQGGVDDDPPGTFRTDAASFIRVAATAAQATLRTDVPPGALTLPLAPQPYCPAGVNLCGFATGQTLLVYDELGTFDVFTVAQVSDAASEITIASRPADSSTTTFRAGSKVVEAQLDAYYLRTDPGTHIPQLMHHDGSASAGVPVVDHLVGLRFEYFGDPSPPVLMPAGVTYGPSPPPIGVRNSAYQAGESCTFTADEDAELQLPRLVPLGPANSLSPLTAANLTDGPWCPDADNANRWDADLLRIRAVAVTLRVQAAAAALRGPAGLLFATPGTSRGEAAWAPDLEVRFQITPRNLSVSR